MRPIYLILSLLLLVLLYSCGSDISGTSSNNTNDEPPSIKAVLPGYTSTMKAVVANKLFQQENVNNGDISTYLRMYEAPEGVPYTKIDTSWEKTWVSKDGKKKFTLKVQETDTDVAWQIFVTIEDQNLKDAKVVDGIVKKDKSSGKIEVYNPKTGDVKCSYVWSTDSAGNKTFTTESEKAGKKLKNVVKINADKSGSFVATVDGKVVLEIKWNTDGSGTYMIKMGTFEKTGSWDKNGIIS